MNTIATNQKQLTSISQALSVVARVENVNGSQETGLYIPDKVMDEIEGLGCARDFLYTAEMAADFPGTPDNGSFFKPINILAANDMRAVPDYQYRQVSTADGTGADFLRGSDAVCLADESFMQQNNLSVGDSFKCQLFARGYDQYGTSFAYKPVGTCSLRIAGSVSSPPAAIAEARIDILCPLGWAKKTCAQAGTVLHLNSASFTVADPLKLNDFKTAMKQYFQSIDPRASYMTVGNALYVDDETFVSTAGRVKSTLAVLNTFAPVVFFVIALIGYSIAYLMMQSRRRELAVMRSLGVSRKACAAVILTEYVLLGLAGSLLGVLCATLWIALAWGTLWAAMLFLLSLMAGILAAVVQISRGNTMTGLVKIES